MGLFTLVILGIVGVGLVILVIGFLLKSIFHVEGKKKGINIPKMLLQLYIIIYFIAICYFKPELNSVFSASLLIGGASAPILISISTDIWETFKVICLSILFGFMMTFLIGIFGIFADSLNDLLNNFSLIMLCISGVVSFISSGEYLSTDIYVPTNSDNKSREKKNRKITATTFNWSSNWSTTTYRDQDGNKTEVDHWKF